MEKRIDDELNCVAGVADVDGGTISGNNNDCHGDKRQESAQLLHPPTDYFDDLFDYERDLDSFATTSAEAVPVPSPLDTPNPVEPSAFSQFSPVQSAAYSPHSAPIAGTSIAPSLSMVIR